MYLFIYGEREKMPFLKDFLGTVVKLLFTFAFEI